MNKEFVKYEQALALKELGFDEPCFGCYDEKAVFGLTVMSIKQYYTNSKEDTWNCAAPTFSQAFRWFRENYQMYYTIIPADLGKYEDGIPDFKCGIYSNQPVKTEIISGSFKTYEEAELACLNKLIELVTDEQTRTTG